jgi:hypothetical protein
MMDHRVLLFSLLSIPLFAACMQELDTGADKGSTPQTVTGQLDPGTVPDPGDGTIPDQTFTPEIQITTDISKKPVGTTKSSCDAIKQQAMWILTTTCGGCHGSQLSVEVGAPNPAQGQPQWNFVDDPGRMMTTIDLQTGTLATGVPFLVKGDPKGSPIYQRIILGLEQGAMPPVYPSPTIPPVQPRPSISDYSILHEWIKSCL